MNNYHCYHFVVNYAMYNSITILKKKHKLSFSKIIDLILSLTSSVLLDSFQKHFEHDSKYLLIDAAEEIWADISIINYRRIKQFHDMMNVYSMAQSVRTCISIFFLVYNKLGSLDATIEHFQMLNAERKKNLKSKNVQAFWDISHMLENLDNFHYNLFIISKNYHLLKEILLE